MVSYWTYLSSTACILSSKTLFLSFLSVVTHSCSFLSPNSATLNTPVHVPLARDRISPGCKIAAGLYGYGQLLNYSLNRIYHIILTHTCYHQSLRFLHQLNGGEMVSHYHTGPHLLSRSKVRNLFKLLVGSLGFIFPELPALFVFFLMGSLFMLDVHCCCHCAVQSWLFTCFCCIYVHTF